MSDPTHPATGVPARLHAADATFAARARELGHAGIAELLDAHATLTNPELGRLLEVSTKSAAGLRTRFGRKSPGRWAADYVPTSPAYRPRMDAVELAALPPGVQPERDGQLLCRCCGQWMRSRGLPGHLAVAHDLTVAGYQARHGLDGDHARAVALGYADVAELLAATAHLNGADFADLVGVDRRQARTLRGRHGFRTPRGHTVAAPVRADELAAVPAGVQPEQHGKLLCRECGRWYRGLAQHLGNKHDLRPADYRAKHGLAISACLQAEDLHDKRVASSRARYEANEEWRGRWEAGRVSTNNPDKLAAVHAARRESAARPGGAAYYQDSGARLAQVLPRRIRAEFTDRARALGYADLEEMLAATAALSGRELARLLNVADYRVYHLRLTRGYSSPGHAGVEPAAAIPPPRPAELPTDRRLTCLECDGRYMHLGKHVTAVHQLSPAHYRRRHHLEDIERADTTHA